jgi:hypothetical protein
MNEGNRFESGAALWKKDSRKPFIAADKTALQDKRAGESS